MKRKGNLYEQIISIENLTLADEIARKGKSGQYGVKVHDQNRHANILKLHIALKTKTFKTSQYTNFIVKDRKEREVSRLPYFPDRIVHHAIVLVIGPILIPSFTADTYSCIKGRGIHAASFAVRRALKDIEATRYCLKLDIKKYYPNVDHDVLIALLWRKFKDADLMWLLEEIIESAPGLPIGNLLSQYFATFYLSGFDHWVKEEKRVRHYFRYMDDIVVLADNKPYLHKLLSHMKGYLDTELKLIVKENYQIFPVESRGIDFVGYVCRHSHTGLRKGIKKNFARMLKHSPSRESLASYNGWIKHCDGKHLMKQLLNDHKLQGIGDNSRYSGFLRRQN